jgi:hypothetical protein
MSKQEEEKTDIQSSENWETIKKSLENLEKIYINLRPGKDQASFEYSYYQSTEVQ